MFVGAADREGECDCSPTFEHIRQSWHSGFFRFQHTTTGAVVGCQKWIA
jgi:hypothetical protein